MCILIKIVKILLFELSNPIVQKVEFRNKKGIRMLNAIKSNIIYI